MNIEAITKPGGALTKVKDMASQAAIVALIRIQFPLASDNDIQSLGEMRIKGTHFDCYYSGVAIVRITHAGPDGFSLKLLS